MAAGTYLCAERIEKFGGGPASATAAVATAVVSKPLAKKTTCFGRVRAGELGGLRHRVDHLHLGAGRHRVGEREGGAREPQHVPVGADADAEPGQRDRLVHLRARR